MREATQALGTAPGRWTLTITVLGSSLGFLDATIVNVALPHIGEELGSDVAGLQWVLDGYLLSLSALILLGGSLSDRFGRRRIFAIGVCIFTVASLLCAAAPSTLALIVARLVQGLGAAMFTPASLALIESSFREQDRGRAIGAWSGLTGLATAAGPLVGGLLVDSLGWRCAFLINLPIGIVVVAMAWRRLPETRDPTAARRLDVPGTVLLLITLAGICIGLIEAPRLRAGSPVVYASVLTGLAGLVAFLMVERRGSDPLLPMEVFGSRQFSTANLLTFVVYAALGGVLFLLTVFLQEALGYSALEAGAATLPITALLLLLSTSMGALTQRIGPRLPLTVGPLVMAFAMVLMTTIDPGDHYVTGVLPSVVVFGLGLSAVVAPVTTTMLQALDERQSGIASGINNAVARVAQLLAVAVLPVAAGLSGSEYRKPAAFTQGFHAAALVTAALAVAGALIAVVGFSRRGDGGRGAGQTSLRAG